MAAALFRIICPWTLCAMQIAAQSGRCAAPDWAHLLSWANGRVPFPQTLTRRRRRCIASRPPDTRAAVPGAPAARPAAAARAMGAGWPDLVAELSDQDR